MKSSSLRTDARRRSYVRLIGEISHALNRALEEEHSKRQLTISEIGRILGKSKSHISRKFRGTSNMTLETLSDLAYALDRPVVVSLPDLNNLPNSNHTATSPAKKLPNVDTELVATGV
jgi:transcriptional regulator with XRE-family HTH domain